MRIELDESIESHKLGLASSYRHVEQLHAGIAYLRKIPSRPISAAVDHVVREFAEVLYRLAAAK